MTKKTLALVAVLLCAALGAAAQEAPAEWVRFAPPAGNFTVLLPSEPVEDKKTNDGPNGPYTTHLYVSRTPGREIYMVGWVDYDPRFNFSVQPELNANRDNFIKSVKANLLSTTPIKLGANPGIEFTAEVPGRVDIVSRVYIVGRRPYQLIMVTPAGQNAAASRERFFSSFKISGSNWNR